VLNGVKQGGVLSPILFCIYIDGLLNKLNSSMTGCCIGSQFTGALAYVDDIVLLAPTAAAMRSMLRICEEYAKAFYVVFNASKSKCVICRHRGAVRNNFTDRSIEKMSFEMCGNAIEVVTSWPHLRHIISADCDDKLDILNRRCSFIDQANNLIYVFGKLDCSVKTKLLKLYCCRAMLCIARLLPACGVRLFVGLSVRLSVTFVSCAKTNSFHSCNV